MSLTSLLSIANSALITQQKAIDVTGHNIANATTTGYTRQQLQIVALSPMDTANGTVGRGVGDTGVVATRDTFLDATYRTEQGNSQQSDTLHSLLSQVEQVFGEPSATGLGSSLDGLFNSFSDLANDPSSGAARAVVQQSGAQIVQQLHSIDTQISGLDQNARANVDSLVSQVNAITTKIAQLNKSILAEGGPNHSAPDLEDQRGNLIDQLSGLVGVRVLDQGNGSVSLVVGDSVLVDGGTAQQIKSVSLPNGGLGVGIVGQAGPLDVGSGQLAALAQLTDSSIPGIRSQLDQLTSALVTTVNAIHETGTTPGGATNTDFFDPTGVTAHTIALAAPIAADPNNIAAGLTANAGDGQVALQLAAVRSTTIAALGGHSIGDYYTSLTGSLGADVNAAQQNATASDALAANASSQRSSETGVSTDEEMTNLIVQQSAYAAATRLVSAANDMMTALMSMVQ